MKSFTYTISDPVGIHARPAGILVKEIKNHDGVTVTVTRGDQSVDARKLMALMAMGVRQGDVVTVSVGPDKVRLVFSRAAIATIEDAPVEATIDGDVKDVK